MTKNRMKIIKVFSAMVLTVTAIVTYISLHGTKTLFIVAKINSVIPIIPIFDGIECNFPFIRGYLVDILWYISFSIIVSLFDSWYGYVKLFFIAVVMELLQKVFKNFGTFDLVDIFLYLIITVFFIFLHIKEKN